MNELPKRFALTAAAILSLGLAGCGREQTAAVTEAPEVGVVTVQPARVNIISTLPGRTAAFRVAEVRPQVTGIVQRRLFTEGSEVRSGQQLLQIDASSYQATFNAAEAALKRAEARLVAANLLAERYEPLIKARAVSRQDYDNAVAERAAADADVAAAKAQLERTRVDVVYTRVLAPISGRIGRALVTEGALVTAGQAEPLALVQQLDPIYVDISQSSADLLRLQREFGSAGGRKEDAQAEVALTLEDGSEYPERGKLQFSEVSVDPGTGSVVLRAIFPNPRGDLLPGMFVRAQLTQGQREGALLVPQRGVSRNQRGEATVLVVGADDQVGERVVTADRVVDGAWLVTAGLEPGERVVVDGLQKVRAGAKVRPVDAAPAAGAPAEVARR